MLGEVKNFGQGGYQIQHAFGFVMLRLPGRTYELMPIAVLIGTLYALSALSRHSEITVLRVSGLSTAALLRGLFQVAGLFAVLTFLIGEYVAPPAEQAANQLRLKERGRMVRGFAFWFVGQGTRGVSSTCASFCRIRACAASGFTTLTSEAQVALGYRGCGRGVCRADGWRLTEVVRLSCTTSSAECGRTAGDEMANQP
jgi:hypothetical protein